MTYLPKQKDIIWIDFDPQRGREIKKRRPAVVLSSNLYTQNTGFVIVSPITSTMRDLPGYFSLNGYNTTDKLLLHKFIRLMRPPEQDGVSHTSKPCAVPIFITSRKRCITTSTFHSNQHYFAL